VEVGSEVYGDGAAVVVGAVIAQKSAPDVNTSRLVAAHDDHEESARQADRHDDRHHGARGDLDRAVDHFVGDCACVSVVEAESSRGAHRMETGDGTLAIAVVDVAAVVLDGDGEHQDRLTAPGLVAVGAASHDVAPTERRCLGRRDADLLR
jgi:hypothetical protein